MSASKRFLDIPDPRNFSPKRPRSDGGGGASPASSLSGSPTPSFSQGAVYYSDAGSSVCLSSARLPSSTDDQAASASEYDEDTPMEDLPQDEEVILIGMLCNIRANVCPVKDHREISFQPTGTSESNLTPLSTIISEDRGAVESDCGKKLAYLNNKTHMALWKVSSTCNVSYTALVHAETLKSALVAAGDAHRQQKRGAAGIHPCSLDLLLSCPRPSADSVARILAKYMLFLQHPHPYSTTLPYENPQYLDIPGASFSAGSILPPLNKEVMEPFESSEAEQGDRRRDAHYLDPSCLLDDLPIPDGIQAVDIDERIKTDLQIYQKEGVDFITRREKLDMPQSKLWQRDTTRSMPGGDIFLHRITGARRKTMDDFPGGLLADDMGLGKTLMMIVAVVTTLASAAEHTETTLPQTPASIRGNLTPVKSTLVLVPSALLMGMWVTEVEKHVQPGALSVYKYHGLNRRLDDSKPLPYDIVISTYATITSDFGRGGGVLSKFNWYRLILDEAHVIRNWSTKQFNAVDNLSATIRWCLTGTPIQNNVGDLGSLVRFLRVPELSNATQFRKYISGIKPQDAMFHRPNIPNLKLMLTSMCLRRSRDIISLPGIAEEICEPAFTKQEKALYDGRVALLKKSITKETNRGPKDKEAASKPVLEAVLRLRIFCNVGLVGRLKSDHLFSLLQQESDTNCRWCDIAVGTMDGDEMSERPRITHCYHLVCGECIPSVQKSRNPSECPICSAKHEGDIFLDFVEREDGENVESQAKQPWPSKLLAVSQNLAEHLEAEKSIVFSFWRQSLDVLGQLLLERGVPYSRIDGQIKPERRKEILTAFGSKVSERVLLMTLGTGAVGLNDLSVASRVHFLEPQWNPSVESQAVGRVLRIGQERKCHIVRYIMKGSIEKSVQERQFIKLDLAAAGGLYSGSKSDRPRPDRSLRKEQLRRLQSLLKPIDET